MIGKIAAFILSCLLMFTDCFADTISEAVILQKKGFQIKAAKLLKNGKTYEELNAYADVLTATGDFTKAIEILKMNEIDCNTLRLYGNVLMASGERDLAIEAYKDALKVCPEDVKLLINAGMFEPEYLFSASEKTKSPEDLLTIGIFALRHNNIDLAETVLTTVTHPLTPSLWKREGKCFAVGYLGQVYERRKQFDTAISLTRKAMLLSQEKPESKYLWEWQLARIFRNTGNTQQALKFYEKAIATLNPIRSLLYANHKAIDIFRYDIKPVYAEYAGLLLSLGKTDSALSAMEELRKAELQEYFLNDCVAEKPESAVKIPSGIAVLYPLILSEMTVIIIKTEKFTTHVEIRIDADNLTQSLMAFREQLQDKSTNKFLKTAKELHQLLFEPVRQILTDVDTLVIVPDGAMRLIPFAALHDGNKFLIENYAIVIEPSFSLVNTDMPNYDKSLVNGLSESVQQFDPLPNVPKEVETVSKIIPGNLLTDSAYTLGNLSAQFSTCDYSVVHFATHGVFGGSPKESFLLTHDGKLDMDTLEELVKSCRKIDLLVLSACQTALGNDKAALGIGGCAIKAGVKSVFATLWFVNDESTSQVISEFYINIRSGKSKAKALQAAQKKVLSQKKFWKPVFWAPYILIGNWL